MANNSRQNEWVFMFLMVACISVIILTWTEAQLIANAVFATIVYAIATDSWLQVVWYWIAAVVCLIILTFTTYMLILIGAHENDRLGNVSTILYGNYGGGGGSSTNTKSTDNNDKDKDKDVNLNKTNKK